MDNMPTKLESPRSHSVANRQRNRSVTRMPPSFQAEDADDLAHLVQELPKRFMSLANLHQFCQDFGVLPDLCDMNGIQVLHHFRAYA